MKTKRLVPLHLHHRRLHRPYVEGFQAYLLFQTMEEAVAFCKRQSVSNERGEKKKKDDGSAQGARKKKARLGRSRKEGLSAGQGGR